MQYFFLFLFGVLIGNFTTTVFHRLPREIMISGFDEKLTRPPFCSTCKHLLRFYEYLPILSWFSTLGKCNYCHNPITKYYIFLEVTIGLFAVILHHIFKSNLEYFFLFFCFASMALLNIAIYLEHNFISRSTTLGIIITGLLFRTLTDGEIFPGLASLSLAFVITLCIIRMDMINQPIFHPLMHMLLPASLWCEGYAFLLLCLLLGFLYILDIVIKRVFYPLGLASMFFVSLLPFVN